MTFIDKYSASIKRLCALYHVKTLYAFGSVVTGQLTDNSDVDFIVDFKSMDLKNYPDNYYNFKYSLQDLLNRPVDLIEEKAIKNPFFKQAVNNKRKLVYGY